jgi:GntR family transcriptional regulator
MQKGICLVFVFRPDHRSAVPAYMQLVHQVKEAIAVGALRPGDRLPTVHEAVTQLLISPNTVLKAYRDLERAGLTVGRPGAGTFVTESIPRTDLSAHVELRARLRGWLRTAHAAGLDDEAIDALIGVTRRESDVEGAA